MSVLFVIITLKLTDACVNNLICGDVDENVRDATSILFKL